MNHTYEIGIRVLTGSVVPAVLELEASLNESMSGFGFDEKMQITSVLPVQIAANRRLTEEELQLAAETIRQRTHAVLGNAELEYTKKISL
jgi:hypothetical protein